MFRCVWVDYIYKLMLMLLGASMVTPGMGKASNIPHFYFNWTANNSRFQQGGAKLSVPIGTNLVIKCPYRTNPPEYYRIVWVPETAFKQCFAPDNDTVLFLVCDKPNNETEFTLEVKAFTGVPGSKDFKAGNNYYLATMSTGSLNEIGNRDRGACLYKNMKLNLTILPKATPTTPGPTPKPSSTTKGPVTPTLKPTSKTTVPTTTSTTTQSTTTILTSQRPHPTDIPDMTDIPIINVPDTPGGNTGVIDISSAQTLRASSGLVLSLCLSLLHILYLTIPYIQR